MHYLQELLELRKEIAAERKKAIAAMKAVRGAVNALPLELCLADSRS